MRAAAPPARQAEPPFALAAWSTARLEAAIDTLRGDGSSAANCATLVEVGPAARALAANRSRGADSLLK